MLTAPARIVDGKQEHGRCGGQERSDDRRPAERVSVGAWPQAPKGEKGQRHSAWAGKPDGRRYVVQRTTRTEDDESIADAKGLFGRSVGKPRC